MRLIGPYLFIFIGVIIGIATTRLFSGNPLRYLPNVVAGVIGSFFGLFLRADRTLTVLNLTDQKRSGHKMLLIASKIGI